jgi:hypothetical protein
MSPYFYPYFYQQRAPRDPSETLLKIRLLEVRNSR